MNTLTRNSGTEIITNLAGHQLTMTGIAWAGEPTAEELNAIAAFVVKVDRANAFLEGDVLIKEVKRMRMADKTMTPKEAIQRYAEANSRTEQECYQRYCVSEFYPLITRVITLTWTHHRDVRFMPGMALAAARDWLAKADASKWTVRQLRDELIKTKKSAFERPVATLPGLVMFPRWVEHSESWFSGQLHNIESFGEDEVAAMLLELSCTVQFIDGLRARAAKVANV